ncbi:NADPH dehydrogenase NamA [Rufibacter latericius]|uniref:NADPH dehydrogenase NamA n=1 Tax=Rufibacter latericius TaxID=2487040 RepID=A0A3M9N0X0_9BACT|nr:NADPH dehydrogenase NamA [Rufibacter latericius]RNI31366.1 NADPH dehydrogenase NamA [Rufibacter latericius]
MSALFTPLQIKSVRLKNRIVVSPMCQYSSQDGFANDWHLVHLGSRAVGGAGLILLEATGVSPEARITPHDLGIWKDEHLPNLKRIVSFLEANGSIAGIQLAHAGRKASHTSPWQGGKALHPGEEGAWTTVAPSAIPFQEGGITPEALDKVGIQKVVTDFRTAAARALEAGFRVVELHGAHGYLLHQFFSPLSNHRTDEYGGSFENRIRLLLEVVDSVKEVWPAEYPLWVRISATDWTPDGWNENDSVALARELKARGVDLIDTSTGGNVPKVRIPVGPGYQVQFAEKIKKEADIMTGAVGMITTPQEAEDIISSGQADVVLLARQLLRDPYFPLRAAKQLGVDLEWPVQYQRAHD